MTIMITGGSGQLGSEIIRQLRDAGRPFLAPQRAECDVGDLYIARFHFPIVREFFPNDLNSRTKYDIGEIYRFPT